MAKNPQNVSFKSLEDFFDFLPDEELKMVIYLRKIVLDCLPNCTEKLSYNVPFYKINKTICFIWPASVAWGKTVSHTGVRFGFNQGYRLRDELNFLDKGSRKQVYWKDFKSIGEIDEALLKTFLFEAADLDSRRVG
ncbi:MAG: DUF1801 domain-containing protein [Bacteroidota bacterium]|nr:DUF1801 domain-containing protein [Bacteroidota bacterium]